jgi:hypothetical protein
MKREKKISTAGKRRSVQRENEDQYCGKTKISIAGKEGMSPQLLNAVPSMSETLRLATSRSVEAYRVERADDMRDRNVSEAALR